MSQTQQTSEAEGSSGLVRPGLALLATAIVCIAAVVVAQVGDFKPPILTGSMRLMAQYESLRAHVERDGPNDIVVIGDSVARQGVVSSLLQDRVEYADGRPLRVFNFGSGGITAESLPMALDLLFGVDQPQHALFIASLQTAGAWSQRTNEYTETVNASPYGRAVLDPLSWRGSGGRWLLDHVALTALRYRMKRAWLGLPEPDRKRKMGGYDERRGYIASRQETKDEMRWEWRGDLLASFELDAQKRAALLRVIRRLQAGGSRVWLVEVPNHPRIRHLLPDPDNDEQRLRDLLAELGEQTGSEVLLQPAAQRPGAGEFADTMHLNSAGALRYTRWIASELAARAPFRKRKDDGG